MTIFSLFLLFHISMCQRRCYQLSSQNYLLLSYHCLDLLFNTYLCQETFGHFVRTTLLLCQNCLMIISSQSYFAHKHLCLLVIISELSYYCLRSVLLLSYHCLNLLFNTSMCQRRNYSQSSQNLLLTTEFNCLMTILSLS